jgi:hypothetical protein
MGQHPQQQRVAVGRGETCSAQLGIRPRRECGPHDGGRGGFRQRSGIQRTSKRVGAQRFRQDVVGAGLVGPPRDHEQDRQRLHPAQQVDQEAQRRLVGPVRVVNCQEQRPAFGDVDGHPVQPVQAGEDRAVQRPCLVPGDQPQYRSGQLCRTGQQGRPIRGGNPADVRIEQLPDDPERQPALELAAAGGQHGHPAGSGPLARGPDQPCLPDPGSPLDHEQAATTAARRLDPLRDDRELGLALEQGNVLPHHRRASSNG